MDNITENKLPLGKLLSFITLLRPQQWIKNTFVLAPLLFSGKFSHPTSIVLSIITLLLFCCASSISYIINDIRDREEDRRHPLKSFNRPLAAGILSLRDAFLLLTFLVTIMAIGVFFLPELFLVIFAFLSLNLLYTFFLKQQPILDLFAIAFGFLLRVYGGAVILSVPVSGWMFITTLCLALYLATLKRRQELYHQGAEGRKILTQYTIPLLDRFAETSKIAALVFYGMFVMSSKPELIITIPLVLFGFFRYSYLVETSDKGECPTSTVLSDWPLLSVIFLWLLACLWGLGV